MHVTKCQYHDFYSEHNLVRLETAFVVIVLLLLSLACGFSIYSLCHPRYTYKRVAGGLHLFSAISILALNQIVESEGHLSAAKLQEEAGSSSSSRLFYGYSHLMAWIAFVISILVSLAFFTWSKKRKHLVHDLETQLH